MRKGQFVLSVAGRDKGSVMLVLGFTEDGRVLAADGRKRKVEKPKIKNPAHLLELQVPDAEPEGITNRKVREAITERLCGNVSEKQEGLFCQKMT